MANKRTPNPNQQPSRFATFPPMTTSPLSKTHPSGCFVLTLLFVLDTWKIIVESAVDNRLLKHGVLTSSVATVGTNGAVCHVSTIVRLYVCTSPYHTNATPSTVTPSSVACSSQTLFVLRNALLKAVSHCRCRCCFEAQA